MAGTSCQHPLTKRKCVFAPIFFSCYFLFFIWFFDGRSQLVELDSKLTVSLLCWVKTKRELATQKEMCLFLLFVAHILCPYFFGCRSHEWGMLCRCDLSQCCPDMVSNPNPFLHHHQEVREGSIVLLSYFSFFQFPKSSSFENPSISCMNLAWGGTPVLKLFPSLREQVHHPMSSSSSSSSSIIVIIIIILILIVIDLRRHQKYSCHRNHLHQNFS